MRSIILSFILTFHTLILLVFSVTSSQGFPFWKPRDQITKFYSCVNSTSKSQIEFSKGGFYDPNYDVESFTSTLNSTAENLRCLAKTTRKPLAIFTPANDIQVKAAVQCALQNWLHIRIRSGGHDYEGLSYISLTGQPFLLIDLRNIRKVDIDISTSTAWVDAGVTTGELYYRISQKSSTLAFPAGIATDLGIGGHITGGAYGSLMRKHGLGVDNVLDAEIVDSRGMILNRKSMGEDLFWAIRGGGGGNFGIILRWKIQLVVVPEKVTVFSVQKIVSLPSKDNMGILRKWQAVAPVIDNELFMRAIMLNVGPNTTLTIYEALYLGKAADVVKVMKASFPELGLQERNCVEMKWIESVMVIGGFQQTTSPKELLKPKNTILAYFKAKSDFVEQAISEEGLEKLLSILGEREGAGGVILWTPYGGKMSDVPEDATSFPHRNALFMMQYYIGWNEGSPKLQLEREAWVRKLYGSMTAHVTKNPRQTYVNYKDLDIGMQNPNWNCSDPRLWGPKYYKGNYLRLVSVKTKVDPWNVFRNEQSIPPSYMEYGCTLFDIGMVK